jgi:hypothetical protein
MSNLKIPAFTAEATLYRTNNHYRRASGGTCVSNGVWPQLQSNPFKDIFNELFSNPVADAVATAAAEGAGGHGFGEVDWSSYNSCSAGCSILNRACRHGCRIAELDNCDYCSKFYDGCEARCWKEAT